MTRTATASQTIAPAATPAGCTALRFRKAARRVSQIYDTFLAPHELTITQYGLLAHIQRLPGSSIGTLAAVLVMDPTTLTRNLRPLRQRALVELVLDEHDRRTRTLRLTASGRATLKKARAGWERAQAHMAQVLGTDHAPLSGAIDAMLARLGS